ncbi:MAG: hypothetical protein ACE5I5_06365 [Candidatus Heimdallarchaeota archaeon]
MPKFYLVMPSGDLEDIEISSYEELDSTQIYLVIVDQEQIIYIWRGVESPNRIKFISSRAAAQYRVDSGGTHSVQSVDQGEEPSTFHDLFVELPVTLPSDLTEEMIDAVKVIEEEPVEEVVKAIIGEEAAVAEYEVVVTEEVPIEEEEAVVEEEVVIAEEGVAAAKAETQHEISIEDAEELLSALKFPPFTEEERDQITEPEVVESKPDLETPEVPQEPQIITEVPPSESIWAIKEEKKDEPTEKIATVISENIEEVLKEFSVPSGYVREFIVSKNTLFTIVRKEVQLLGVKEERLELQKELPDGSHPVQGYLIRLLVKNGTIHAVEFLRKHSPQKTKDNKVSEIDEEERNELLSAMRKEIEELRS